MTSRLHAAVLLASLLAACGSDPEKTAPPPVVDPDRSTLAATPSTAVADGTAAVTLTATARDAGGAPIPGRTATFTVTGSDITLSAASSTTDAAGVASVTLTSTRAEAKSASVVVDAVAVRQVATATFGPGPAATLSLAGVPAATTAGAGEAVTLTARDAFGNVATGYRGTVHATSSDPQAQLPADRVFAEADAGRVTFPVAWRTAGAMTLTLTDDADGSLTATGSTSVAPAAPFRLAFAAQPSGATAGALLTPSIRVSVLDAFGNLVASGSPSVSLQLQGGAPGATLSGGGANVASGGVAEFAAVSLDKAGAYLLAADSAGLLGAASEPFSIAAAEPDASASSVSALPASLAAGASASLVATVRDLFGNPVPGVAVTFDATGSANTLSQPATVTDAAGMASGSLTSTQAEAKTVTALAGLLALTPRPVVTFAAGPAHPARSTAVAAPASIVADGATSATITVTLLDAHDNPIPGQWVALSSDRGLVDVLSGWWETTDALGRVTFAVRSNLAGMATLTAVISSGATPVSLSTQLGFVAGPVSAARSTVVASPAAVNADGSSPVTVTVTLLDASGNAVSGKDVALASDRGAGDVVTPASGTSDAAGVVSFTAVSSGFGTATFTATDTTDGLTLLQTAQVAFTGTVSPSRSTLVASAPSVLANGSASSAITVTVLDAFGNPVAGEPVALASDRGALDAISPASGTTDAAGNVTFAVTSRTFGASTFTATATAYGLSLTPTASVTFLSYLAFTTQPPATLTAGVAFDPPVTVAAQDAEGNTDAGFSADVTLALGTNPYGGTLSGTLTVAPSGGVASFADLQLDKAGGGYTLVATTPAPGIPAVTSTPFLVEPGSPAALAFAVQPSNSGAGIAPMILVAVLDAYGNTTAATGVEVALALGTNPTGATLGGPLTAWSSQGVATFEALSVSDPGAGYTLVASDPFGTLSPATSLPFDVLSPGTLGDGTPGSCTEATLDAALASGGHYHFDCGPDPVTITLTSTKTIARNVGLDGGGLVTLSGAGARQLFSITDPSRTVALENLTLTAGATGGNGGAIYSAGTLSLSACTVSNSVASSSNAYYGSGANGGAVHNDAGTLLISATSFSANSTGGNWNSYGTYYDGGALYVTGGTVVIADSTFSGNAAGGYAPYGGTSGNGGAIFHSGGTLRVTGTVFSGNSTGGSWADGGTHRNGGAIFSASGTLLVTGSTFQGNSASAYGPSNGTFGTGGAIHLSSGTASVVGTTFSGNGASSTWPYGCTAGDGGAIFVAGGALIAANSTFTGNGASAYGPYYSTVASGGAIFNAGGRVQLVNATVANNSVGVTWCDASTCGLGSGILGGAALANTIVSGDTCHGTFTDGGHNLDASGSCGVGPATDPLLAAAGLADNGGPTKTVALQDGSPAIDAGDPAVCSAAPVLGVDQRGYQRPGDGASTCSIGAFEYASPGPP